MSQERYKNAIIYKLMSYKTDKIIVDGCCCSLARRKQDMKRIKNTVTLAYIKEYPDYYLSIIEEYPCKNKDFLNTRISEVKKDNLKFHCEVLEDLVRIPDIKRTEPVSPKYLKGEETVTKPQPPPLPPVSMGRTIRPHSLTIRTT